MSFFDYDLFFGYDFIFDYDLFFDYVGLYAPIILFLLSLFFLFDKTTYMIIFIIGFIINNILNILLKLLIRQPRPNEDKILVNAFTANNGRMTFDKYGMPSGHAQSVGFALMFISLVLCNHYITSLYLIITILSLMQRYKYNNHTILQLFVGLIIGIVLAYILYKKFLHLFW